jgi:predicted RNA binding protein YcfA (HicA-like mRNA interferase family)
MSEKLPRVTAREVERAIIKIGYQPKRQSGSHRIYKNQEGKRITLPIHPEKIIHPKIIKRILVENNLTSRKIQRIIIVLLPQMKFEICKINCWWNWKSSLWWGSV